MVLANSQSFAATSRAPLSGDEVVPLLRAAQSGDKDALERLVSANMRLVSSIAVRFRNSGHDMDDLFQIGCIGLIKAIEKFDTSRDVRLSTYAVPLIIGEIRRFLRDDGLIKVSRSVKELGHKAARAKVDLSLTLGREASIAEIAEELGVDSQRIVEALDAVSVPASLHQPTYCKDGRELLMMDQIAVSPDETGEAHLVDRMTLKDALGVLDTKERQVVALRFFRDKSQSEVAKILDISQPQVSRVEKRALHKIRRMLESGYF